MDSSFSPFHRTYYPTISQKRSPASSTNSQLKTATPLIKHNTNSSLRNTAFN